MTTSELCKVALVMMIVSAASFLIGVRLGRELQASDDRATIAAYERESKFLVEQSRPFRCERAEIRNVIRPKSPEPWVFIGIDTLLIWPSSLREDSTLSSRGITSFGGLPALGPEPVARADTLFNKWVCR